MKKILPLIITSLLLMQQQATAQQLQVENTMSQYFRNRMLWNAAYTGDEGNKLYVLQNRSWVGFEGAPVLTSFNGEFKFGQNSSAGLQVLSDQTGILVRTYGILNYGYRIKLSEENSLRLGISLSLSGDRLNNKYLDGSSLLDPMIASSINDRPRFDGNFGAIYRSGKFDVGVALYHLGDQLRKEAITSNAAKYQVGLYYNLSETADKMQIKPVLMYKTYTNTESVLEGGAQVEYNKLLHVMAMYQSIGNVRAGAGLRKNGLGEANFFYNTNVKIANVSSQQYEMGLAVYLK